MLLFGVEKLLARIGSMPQPDTQDVEDDLGGYILRLMAHSPQRKLVKEIHELVLLREETEGAVDTLMTSSVGITPSTLPTTVPS